MCACPPVPLGTLGGRGHLGNPHGLQVCLASPEAPAQPLPVQRPHPPSGSPEGLGVPGSGGVLQRPEGTGPRPGDPTRHQPRVGRAIALLGSQWPPRPVVSLAEAASGSRHLGRPVGNCSPHPGGQGGPGGNLSPRAFLGGQRPAGSPQPEVGLPPLARHLCGQRCPLHGHAHPEISVILNHKEAAAFLILRVYSKIQR